MNPIHRAALLLYPPFIGKACGRELDSWQEEVVIEALVNRRDCVLRCGRQIGKTETAAQSSALVLQVPEIIKKESALVVLTSPSQRQSGEIHRRLLAILDAMGADYEEKNRMSLKLTNGSRFLALPGSSDTLRGIAGVDLLILDEAAYIDESLPSAIRPMLATSGGNSLVLSTPADPVGFFYQVATGTDDRWVRWHIPTASCPRVSKEFLDAELALLGPELFAREYNGEFVSMDGGLLSAEEIAQLTGSFKGLKAPSLGELAQSHREREIPMGAVAAQFDVPNLRV